MIYFVVKKVPVVETVGDGDEAARSMREMGSGVVVVGVEATTICGVEIGLIDVAVPVVCSRTFTMVGGVAGPWLVASSWSTYFRVCGTSIRSEITVEAAQNIKKVWLFLR